MGVATLLALLSSTAPLTVDDGHVIAKILATRPMGPAQWSAFAALPAAEQLRVITDLRSFAPKNDRGRVAIAWLAWIAQWRDPPEPLNQARDADRARDVARAENFAAGILSQLRKGPLRGADLEAFARLTDWEQTLVVDALVAVEPRGYEIEKAIARLDEVGRRTSERTDTRSPGRALAQFCVAALGDGRTPSRREWLIFADLPGPERRMFLDVLRERRDHSPDSTANLARFEWIDARPSGRQIVRTNRVEPYVSPGTALWVSSGVTAGLLLSGILIIPLDESSPLLGIVLATIGLTFGPSAGYYYIGEAGHATLFGALRLVSFVPAALLGLIRGFDEFPDDDDRPILTVIVASLAVSLGLVIWDFANLRGVAERKNEGRDVVITPSAVIDREGSVAPALALAVRF